MMDFEQTGNKFFRIDLWIHDSTWSLTMKPLSIQAMFSKGLIEVQHDSTKVVIGNYGWGNTYSCECQYLYEIHFWSGDENQLKYLS